jgi:hypothetical protein
MLRTRSNGRKKAEALEDLLPAFRATALPWQSTTGEPLEPPLVPDAAYRKKQLHYMSTGNKTIHDLYGIKSITYQAHHRQISNHHFRCTNPTNLSELYT